MSAHVAISALDGGDLPRRTDPPDDPSKVGWLLLIYRVPTEPSRVRATVWRRLKGCGAIYLHNSVAALPDSPPHERMLRTLRAEISSLAGTAQLFRADALVGGNDVNAAYNAARDDEYEEIVDKCRDFPVRDRH
jgi:hypothetical protein